MFLGQEDHAHAIFAGRRQCHALLGHFFAVELIRDLDQDTGAVAHQGVRTHSTAMVDVFEDLQCPQHDVMALLALDMGHKAQTAGIVFVALGVQTVVLEILDLGSSRHGESSYINRGERKITTGHEVMQ